MKNDSYNNVYFFLGKYVGIEYNSITHGVNSYSHLSYTVLMKRE